MYGLRHKSGIFLRCEGWNHIRGQPCSTKRLVIGADGFALNLESVPVWKPDRMVTLCVRTGCPPYSPLSLCPALPSSPPDTWNAACLRDAPRTSARPFFLTYNGRCRFSAPRLHPVAVHPASRLLSPLGSRARRCPRQTPVVKPRFRVCPCSGRGVSCKRGLVCVPHQTEIFEHMFKHVRNNASMSSISLPGNLVRAFPISENERKTLVEKETRCRSWPEPLTHPLSFLHKTW